MRAYTLVHLSTAVLLRELAALAARDRETTAMLLAHIAEVDARKAYVPAGYASLFIYCVEELRFSEDAAYKRIQAARAARQFPVLFEAVAEGRLHLTAVGLLAPHLTAENVEALVAAATGRKKFEIETYLAARFGVSRPSAPASSITPLPSASGVHSTGELALEQVGSGPGAAVPERKDESSPANAATRGQLALEQVAAACVEPAPQRYLVRVTIDQPMHELLVRAQELLSHAIPSGDVAQVLHRALGSLVEQLEKRKYGAGSNQVRRSSKTSRGKVRSRYISAHVRRAVRDRDRGQCTFVGREGRRCGERRFLEFDHVEPVARGGTATVNGLRLRCRAHNQYDAEQVFGAGFMTEKREAARLARAEALAREKSAREAQERELRERQAREQDQDVVAGLRGLGCRADEARRAAEHTRGAGLETIEDRMRAALTFLARRSRRIEIGTPDRALLETGHVRERGPARHGPGSYVTLARERSAGYGRCPSARASGHDPTVRARSRASARARARASAGATTQPTSVRPRFQRTASPAARATLAPCAPSPIRFAT